MAGRPALYQTDEQLSQAVNDYFQIGVKIRKIIIGKAPNQTVEEIPVPTITGLAYHLGFESRQSFYDYEEREEFSYTIKRARLFIEKEYEEQLTAGNTTGAIFALKNMGWKDKTEQEITGAMPVVWREERTYETKDQQKSNGLLTKGGIVPR